MASTATGTMRTLAERAWEQQQIFSDRDVLVDESIPVLYFGDLKAYRSSPLKVITVGLNPSDREFPEHNPQKRFDFACPGEGYLDSLNQYFSSNTHLDWFRNYEKLLQGMNASYYGGQTVALHTDLCSPLATKDTWNDLSLGARQDLIKYGRPLWKELVNELQPDLIVASVAIRHINNLGMEEGPVTDAENYEIVYTVTEKRDGSALNKPYNVRRWSYHLSNGQETSLVYAPAKVTPLQGIIDEEKRKLGRVLSVITE